MIDALEIRRMAVTGPANRGPPVSAFVHKGAQGSAVRSSNYDGTFAHERTLEVAGVGNFSFQSDVVPSGALKDSFLLQLVHARVRVDPEGNSADAFFGPRIRVAD